MPNPNLEDAAALLEPGRNCWRIERAGRAALVVDAADYFRLARKAMLNAKRQILLIGWDLDTRIYLDEPGEAKDGPVKLGPLLTHIARHHKSVKIHILAWDGAAYKFLGRGTTVFRMLRWRLHPRIHLKLDTKHPLEGSHHHKILVIDDELAFCGGIDMTASRWDTREHKDHHPRRRRPTTGRRYMPWHDATMAVDGGVAAALGDLARFRWETACGTKLPCPDIPEDHDLWPEDLEPGFRGLKIAVARTRGKTDELEEVREIEAAFVDLILAARRSVYVESQYFASRAIGEAIVKRLQEPDGPEFIVINPRSLLGWLEAEVMSSARSALLRELKAADPHGRIRVYTPCTEEGEEIYCHAKIMIVDDEVLRVGSANLNNRSMGLDSECDLIVHAGNCEEEGVRERIRAIREDLIAEHLGTTPEAVRRCFDETGSLIACIEKMRGQGRTLVPLEPDELAAIQEKVVDLEIFDPEAPGKNHPFEPASRKRLLSPFRRFRRKDS